MRNCFSRPCLLFCFLIWLADTSAQTFEPKWESLDRRPVPQWFQDAKFGIFIHWGVYSVPAWAPADAPIGVYAKYAEWYWNRLINDDKKAHPYFKEFHEKMFGANFKYQDFAPQFKAELFDPDKWADVFQRSGAKYVVLTSKHHEGFALWPSAQSWNWNSFDIGPHRDLCGDLTRSVKAKGLHMGFYYSFYEWFNPVYLGNVDKYVDEHMLPQMRDLVIRYQPDVVWPDGEWDYTSDKWKSEQFLAWLYNESPVRQTVAVNDRWGKETRSRHGGYYTTEYNFVHEGQEEDMPAHPWEECRGIGTSFGYNRVEDLSNYMTSKQLVDLLIEKVSGGGNLLLDIGPTADGRIPVIMQQRLLDMGEWLNVNGEAVYGTTVWKNRPKAQKGQTIFFTTKGSDLFIFCTRWPSQPVVIEGLARAGSVSLLGSDTKVASVITGGKLTISPPAITPGNMPCQYAWVLKVADYR